MPNKPHFIQLPLVIATQLALLSLHVSAQDNPSAEKDLERIEVVGKYTVNETIDTATGLGLSVLETPQSVSVITAQRIRDQAFSSINEVVAQTVGLSAKQVDSTRNTFSARGFDIDKYQIDGVPMAWSLAGDSGETITDVAIYERIEVVRGATGLLTGAGDPSASINLVRKHANASELTGYLHAGIGSWNNKFVTADLSSALTTDGKVRARVVAKKEAGDSFMRIASDDKTVLYGVIDADLTDNTVLSVGSSYQDNQPEGSTWGGLAAWFTDGTPTNWDPAVTSSAYWTYWQSTNANTFANLQHNFSNGWQGKISFNHNKNTADTKLLYVYGSLDKQTGIGLEPWPYKSSGFSKQSSVDLQLKGDFEWIGRSHEFVIGALKSTQNAETDTFARTSAYVGVGNFYLWDGSYPEPTFSASGDRQEDVETEQEGYYAASRLNLTDHVKFIAGARLSSWQREGTSWGVDANYGDDSVLVPYLGLMYQLSPEHNFYLSQTEIFKPQNARDVSGRFIEPVTGTNRELGLKSALLEGAIQTSVAVFQVQQDHLAQNTFVPFPDKPIEMIHVATDGVESTGFELEVIGQLSDVWKLSAGYSQFKAEDALGTEVNTDHPRKKLNIFTTYNMSQSVAGLEIGGGFSWEGSQYSGIGAKKLTQNAFTLVDLMARYQVSEQFSMQLNINNLFDKIYFSQIGFFEQYGYGSPRNVSVGLTYSF